MKQLEVDIENKSFSDNLSVLVDFKFKINSGEFVAIVGPSGAGKTTLLNIIAELDNEYTGRVRKLSGQDYDNGKLDIGFMFQQARLMPWLSVLENIKLVIKSSAKTSAQVPVNGHSHEKALQMIEQVGLKGFENSYPRQLSGGMQKRVALARAFAVDPQLLLLDEPFQSLDSPTANMFRDQLMAMWDKEKQTILFVTHDLREAISMADRILFLSNRPSRILLDYNVKLERPRSIDSEAVSSLHQSILTRHPDILSGRLDKKCLA